MGIRWLIYDSTSYHNHVVLQNGRQPASPALAVGDVVPSSAMTTTGGPAAAGLAGWIGWRLPEPSQHQDGKEPRRWQLGP